MASIPLVFVDSIEGVKLIVVVVVVVKGKKRNERSLIIPVVPRFGMRLRRMTCRVVNLF